MLRSSRCSRGSAERDRHAFAPGAAGPADAMDVRLGRGRHVVVDDVRQLRDVEAARGDVGRDEQIGRPARNRFITRSRCSCDIPPCSASAR